MQPQPQIQTRPPDCDLDAGLRRLGYADFRPGQREAIETLLAGGRLLLVAPTGGGKSLIASFEDKANSDYTKAPFFAYGLGLQHKHLPEITRWSGLRRPPVFVPSVGRFNQGMIVQVPLQLWSLPDAPSLADVHAALADHYRNCRFVKVPNLDETATITRLQPDALNGTNELQLYVFGNNSNRQAVIAGVIDNLGKGASGQAVQNMNIMLGRHESEGLP